MTFWKTVGANLVAQAIVLAVYVFLHTATLALVLSQGKL